MLVKTDGVLINFPAIVDPQEDGALEVSDAASDVLVDIVRSMPIGCALNAIQYVLHREIEGSDWKKRDLQTIYDAIASNLHNRFIETYEDKVVMERNAPRPVSQGARVYCVMQNDILTGAAYLSHQACLDEVQRINDKGGQSPACVQQATIKDGVAESIKGRNVYVVCDDNLCVREVFDDMTDANNSAIELNGHWHIRTIK